MWQCVQHAGWMCHVGYLTYKIFLENPCLHFRPEDDTPEHVFSMLMRNFNRVYRGEEDELGNFIEGSRAPWGLYMHAAWFFGQPWHYDGYKMFIAEITNNTAYPDVYIVPVEAGLR